MAKSKENEGTEEAYLPTISSNTSLAVEAAPLNDIAEEPLAGAEGVDEGVVLFVAGILFCFTPETLPTFSAACRDRAAALAPGAWAFPAGPARFPPCMTALPCRLRAGAVVPWAMARPTWPTMKSARGD